ncbi:hypothetical protein [Rhodovulum sulfidophilum]
MPPILSDVGNFRTGP